MTHFSRTFVLWLPLALGLTGAFGMIAIAEQQNYRQNANDPQIQMAEDAAMLIVQSGAPASAVSREAAPIDIATSLAPWIVVYDEHGLPLESSAVLNDAPPQLPLGLFNQNSWLDRKTWTAPTGNETRVTWQPQADVREAVVLVHYTSEKGSGFVAVGRNLREVEVRIEVLELMSLVGWLLTEIATFLFVLGLSFIKRT